MEFIGIFVLVLSFVILLVIGVPIAFSIGISGILTMLVGIDIIPALTTFSHRMATGLDSFALLAIPFFILAGNIMNSGGIRSEEHTSELQSRPHLVCRLLLEKKKKQK